MCLFVYYNTTYTVGTLLSLILFNNAIFIDAILIKFCYKLSIYSYLYQLSIANSLAVLSLLFKVIVIILCMSRGLKS